MIAQMKLYARPGADEKTPRNLWVRYGGLARIGSYGVQEHVVEVAGANALRILVAEYAAFGYDVRVEEISEAAFAELLAQREPVAV